MIIILQNLQLKVFNNSVNLLIIIRIIESLYKNLN